MKKCIIKENLNLKIINIVQEQLNKTNQPEKQKSTADNLRENHKEVIRKNKLILK